MINLKLATKKTKKKKEEEAPEEADSSSLLESILIAAQDEKPKPQLINLYGEIDEEKIGDVCFALRVISGLNVHGRDAHIASEKEGEFEPTPIEMIVSSHGGSAADMFSLYDTIRFCKDHDRTEIATTGLGKVMSAGVLLLAAGTKGKRRIGENCRVMLHGVASGHVGQIHNLENELDEAKWTQDRYVKALVRETNMTARYIKKLFDRRQNVYLTAEEAVELGIADVVF